VAAGPLEPESGLPPSIVPLETIIAAQLAGIDVPQARIDAQEAQIDAGR
jgi:hypothetical protein